jgi:hypothetical protein
MDNLSSHKRAAVKERIEAAGATLRFLICPLLGGPISILELATKEE